MMRRYGPGWVLAAGLVLLAGEAHALVASPVGGREGQVDANLQVTLERGKIEPNENEASWQSANWELYSVGGGYTIGDFGDLQDAFVRLQYSFYDSPAEVPDANVAPADCAGVSQGGNRCEIHPADQGHLVALQLGFNAIHQPAFALGFYLQGQVPIGVNYDKFVIPRTDVIGGGTAVGVRLRPWLTYESRTFFGTGPLNGKQNATVALLNNFGFEAKEWLLPWPIKLTVGPYFDADLTERYDDRYDAAFVSGVPTTADGSVAGPGDTRDRIRMMRFGLSFGAIVAITEHFAVEGNFTQKLFGYDTPATQFISFGVRAAF